VEPVSEKDKKRFEKTLISLSTNLFNCLFHENQEIVLETLRVLGNLTRIPIIITVLIEKRIEEAFFLLLQSHANSSIVSAIIGIFINMTASSQGRENLLFSTDKNDDTGEEQHSSTYVYLMQLFAMILRKLTLADIHIATLISQVVCELKFYFSRILMFDIHRHCITLLIPVNSSQYPPRLYLVS
jgi:hypothetical protein